MGKLFFIYGTMGSSKTANALMQYFELKTNNKNVMLFKPEIDTRDGELVKSRIGLEQKAYIIHKNESITRLLLQNIDILTPFNFPDFIIIDECQFLSEAQIDELKQLTLKWNLKIYCYGLKTDFTSHLFEGSKRLLEIADEIRKLNMQCMHCANEAEINARIDDKGNVLMQGDQVVIGANDKYKALCYDCWLKCINKRREE